MQSTLIELGGRLLEVGPGAHAAVMAIINITPDSFFAGSRLQTDAQIATSVERAIEDGAAIIDLGGYSSRPGATDVASQQEYERLAKGFATVRRISGSIPVSIDTFRSAVTERLYDDYGPHIVNDISAGRLDSAMIPTVGRLGLPYIAMHMVGTPQTMTTRTHYPDMMASIIEYFVATIDTAHRHGVKDLILDPGFGFAKTVEQNFELLSKLDQLLLFDIPLLVGLSRKSMIWRTLEITPDESLTPTAMLHFEALSKGASILRAHDTLQARQAVRMYAAYAQQQ